MRDICDAMQLSSTFPKKGRGETGQKLFRSLVSALCFFKDGETWSIFKLSVKTPTGILLV